MFRLSHRKSVVSTGTIALCLALASVAAAQSGGTVAVRDVHVLGGSTAFYKPPMTTVASLKRMAGDPRLVADIRNVLGQAGISDLADNVVAALVAANTSVMGGACSDATPADGTLVECEVQPGQTLQWMAYRPRGGAVPGLLRGIRWAGQRPFRAYLFRITEDNRTYTFVIPKECGNVSLMGVNESPRLGVVPVAAAPPPPPPTPPAPAFTTATAPPPPPQQQEQEQASPPPPPTQAPPPPPAGKASPFFIDALVGKERRVRPLDSASSDPSIAGTEGTGLEFAQCSPLLGLKFGVAKRFQNDWELAGALGVAFSLVNGDDKVKEHELFADIEANKYLSGGTFLGTGLSLWDLTRSDTFTPAWMVHVGFPLAKGAKFPVYLLVEGRLFFDNMDDVTSNYQFWGGVRVRF